MPYEASTTARRSADDWRYDDTPHIGPDAHKQWWTPWFLMGLTGLTVSTFLVLLASGVILR
jgi:hypothetical protein